MDDVHPDLRRPSLARFSIVSTKESNDWSGQIDNNNHPTIKTKPFVVELQASWPWQRDLLNEPANSLNGLFEMVIRNLFNRSLLTLLMVRLSHQTASFCPLPNTSLDTRDSGAW